MYNSSPEEYRNAAERILRYLVTENEWPSYVTVPEGKEQFKRAEYEDAIKRVEAYINKEKKFPPAIRFGTPSPEKTDLYTICKTTSLKMGSKGQCVTYAQQKLQEFGFYTRQVDGDFGEYTKQAVIAFQNATGHTPDGVLGPKTWSSFPTYKIAKPGVVQGDEWVLQELRKRGPLNSLRDLRNIIAKYGAYLYYYDQQQSQYKTVTTLKANCADWCADVLLPVARALGITVKAVHCQVRCLDGQWYGHYIGIDNSGTKLDPAAWAKGKGYGELICSNGYNFLHYETRIA